MNSLEDEKIAYDEFTKAIHDSHGKGNNSTIWNLISVNGCTADDLKKVCQKTTNMHHLRELGTYRHNPYAVRRAVNKIINNRKLSRRSNYTTDRTFYDYKWYFKYVPEEHMNKPLFIEKEYIPKLLNKSCTDSLPTRALSLYAYKYTTELLEHEHYPSDLLYDRFKGTSDYTLMMTPYSNTDLQTDYSQEQVYVVSYGNYKPIDDYIDSFYKDYDRTDDSYELTKDVQRKLLEQAVQLQIVCTVMYNEIDCEDENDHVNYLSFLLSSYRKTGTKKRNYPQTNRLELFSQTKSLEMLLAMGLGIKCKTRDNWAYRTSNKKLNKRIQTAYKTFVKAKTVDDRKAMRKLLIDQANILINDFMGGRNRFECVELKCATEQDKVFANNLTSMTTIKPTSKAKKVTSSAPVKYVKANVSLDALLKAPTTAVNKARN